MTIKSFFTKFFLIFGCIAGINSLYAEHFYSQCGQDEYIFKNIFPGKNKGIFIEIGAYDGIKLSNTLFFELQGWTGICIEPIPEMFEQLKKNRACVCIQGCVTDHGGTALFRRAGVGGMLSGLVEKYDPRHVQRIEQEHGFSDYYQVSCYTLSQILSDYKLDKVDFLSIDTEGGELDILKSLSEQELACIDVICVEDNFYNSKNCEIEKYLTSNNFKLVVRLGHDLIFRNKKYLK